MPENEVDLSLVIACYNEEELLEESVREVVEVLDDMNCSYEVLFIDDCSQDGTRAIIDRLMIRYQDRAFRKFFHSNNKGRGATVVDGIRMARGKVVGFIDIDLEVHARYIPHMVSAIARGADVATAHRLYTIQLRSINRVLLSRGYSWLLRQFLKVELNHTEAGFKFFNRRRILPILDQVEDERWFWDTEIMVRSYLEGYRIVEIPCDFVRRFDKKSTVKILGDTTDYIVKLWKFRKTVKMLRHSNGQKEPAMKQKVDVEYERSKITLLLVSSVMLDILISIVCS